MMDKTMPGSRAAKGTGVGVQKGKLSTWAFWEDQQHLGRVGAL